MTTTRKARQIMEIDGPADGWLSVPQAALALGMAKATVLQRALTGQLDSQTVAGRVFVSRASVERLAAAAAQ